MGRFDAWDLVFVFTFVFCGVLPLLALKTCALCGFTAAVLFAFAAKQWSFAPADAACLKSFLRGNSAGAHRGLTDEAPENTLGAIRLAKERRATAVEFDVEVTQDGVGVLLHDYTVDRTTNGSGSIRRMTLVQAQSLKAAAQFANDPRFADETIPTLDEAVKLCLQLDLKIFFDVKAGDERVVNALLALYKRHERLYDTAAICSFFPSVIFQVKGADRRIVTAHTWRPFFYSYANADNTERRFDLFWLHPIVVAVDYAFVWLLHRWLWKFSGNDLILTEHRSISGAYVSEWRRRGVTVVAWTVNEPHEKLYLWRSLRIPFLTDRLSDVQKELAAESQTAE